MMSNRIHELHLKINALLENRNNWTAIDVDLLLDYTRVFYADLLEIKGELITSQKDFTESGSKKIESNVIDSNLINGSVQHIEMDDAQKSVSSSGSITLEMPPNSFKKELNNHKFHSNVDVDLNKISVEEGEIYNAETSTLVEGNNNISQNSHKTNIEKKEVRKLIGINDKYLFMNELFNNDKFDYESVLDYINQANNQNSVLDWLDNEYIVNKKWDREDKTVALFYGVVDKYFSNLR